MTQEYSYPIDVDWSTEEVIDVVQFFESIEKAKESNVQVSVLKKRYQLFKNVVKSKAEEKSLFKAFESSSGIQPFDAVKQLKDKSDNESISI